VLPKKGNISATMCDKNSSSIAINATLYIDSFKKKKKKGPENFEKGKGKKT
jgi:hypothetical protein